MTPSTPPFDAAPTGVHTSTGAASSVPFSALESTGPPRLADVAAPGDGRTPVGLPRGATAAFTICVLLGAAASLVLFCFDPRQYHFYPICFFHQTTGLLCPGCGSLRAMHQLLHGHLVAAFHFNPVLIVSLPFAGWFSARFAVQKARCQPLSLGLRPAWLWLGLAVVFVVSVLRNLPGAPFALLRP